MLPILEKLLKSRRIEKVEDLNQEEKTDFLRWEQILSSGEVTIEKIAAFCANQLDAIKANLKNVDNSTEKNSRLIMLQNVYDSILEAINAPQERRKEIENYLHQLIEKSGV